MIHASDWMPSYFTWVAAGKSTSHLIISCDDLPLLITMHDVNIHSDRSRVNAAAAAGDANSESEVLQWPPPPIPGRPIEPCGFDGHDMIGALFSDGPSPRTEAPTPGHNCTIPVQLHCSFGVHFVT